MSFAVDLRRFSAQTQERLVVIPRKIALEVLRRVVMRTPVDQGRARGNWQTEVGTMNEGESDVVDPGGGAAIEAGVSAIESWTAENVGLFIFNNVPYIGKLEDGYSDQAPAGMVKVTVAEFDMIVDMASREGA